MSGLWKLAAGALFAVASLAMAPAASAWFDDLCLSFGGVEIYQSGDATCFTESGGNFAAAVGAGSHAEAADGSGNTAIALHDSTAEAEEGNDNLALALWGSVAEADSGDGNVSIAVHDSDAETEEGSYNTAIAKFGGDAWAGEGSDNVAVALHDSEAIAGGQRESQDDAPTTACAASAGVLCLEDEESDRNTAFALEGSFACAGASVECQPDVCGAGETAVECNASIAPVSSADDNTAIALHDSDAFAGGPGPWDLNTAIAAWNCMAAAVGGSELSDSCGLHGSGSPTPP